MRNSRQLRVGGREGFQRGAVGCNPAAPSPQGPIPGFPASWSRDHSARDARHWISPTWCAGMVLVYSLTAACPPGLVEVRKDEPQGVLEAA